MTEAAEGAGFFLPSEFFTDDDDDFLMDKENLHKNNDSLFRFPYKPECDPDSLLDKGWGMMSTSPQSTLAHYGTWSSNGGSPIGVPSPPTTPQNDDVADLIHRAAGRLAKLRLGDGLPPGPPKQTGPMGPQAHRSSSVFRNDSQLMWGRQEQMYQSRDGAGTQAAWAGQRDPTRVMYSGRRVVGSGVGAGVKKRECVGTGVFLPRRYESNAYSSDLRKKPVCPSAFVSDRATAHALTKNFDSHNGYAQSQSHSQPLFNRGFISEYDTLMARKHAMILQHRRNMLLAERSVALLQHRRNILAAERSMSMCRDRTMLPQDWTN